MKKYRFVRFKSLIDGKESNKWWLAVNSSEMVIEHTERFLKPTMQEGFNSAASDVISAVFKHGDAVFIGHATNEVSSAIQTISGINYKPSPLAFFDTANEMMCSAVNGRLRSVGKGRIIYLEDGVREFGYNEKTPHFEICEERYNDVMVYPDFNSPTIKDVRFIQWDGGTHWYAKIDKFDVVDKNGNQKWNSKVEAEIAAKWYIEQNW